MKIVIDIDTNDYDAKRSIDYPRVEEWWLFGLSLATFQDWQVVGQTPFWTVDGESFCGTRYSCTVNYKDTILLRCLIDKIKKTCGDRFISISIDDLPVKFTDDDLMEMRPEWIETMKQNR